MTRTPLATTEDIDNANFFASRRLADLLHGETSLDLSDEELEELHITADVEAIDVA